MRRGPATRSSELELRRRLLLGRLLVQRDAGLERVLLGLQLGEDTGGLDELAALPLADAPARGLRLRLALAPRHRRLAARAHCARLARRVLLRALALGHALALGAHRLALRLGQLLLCLEVAHRAGLVRLLRRLEAGGAGGGGQRLLHRQRWHLRAHLELLHHRLGCVVEVTERVQLAAQLPEQLLCFLPEGLLLVLHRPARGGPHIVLLIQLA
mmetsp:Transcript_42967/g.109961  ORF Transcript_42967/g.109961 Transcript_42967/m.109961 type:complete len:214 (-) Transcript_42967:1422-2063(-)